MAALGLARVAMRGADHDLLDDASGPVVEMIDAETLPGKALESGGELVERLPLIGLERCRVLVNVIVSGPT